MTDPYRYSKPLQASNRADLSIVSRFFRGIFKVGLTLLLIRAIAEPLLRHLEQ